jgi:predicted nucleic acid-binding protein
VAKYALDTNVYIDAFRKPSAAEELKAFLTQYLPITYLSAVVIQELRAGTRSRQQVAAFEEGLLAPFAKRRRVFAPSPNAFRVSGQILAELAVSGDVDLARVKASFVNDTLLAASCLEHGMTLITRDSDFSRIKGRLKAFRHIPPWP